MADKPENRTPSGPVEIVRTPKGRFAEGTSGNPGGRNPERERLRAYLLERGQVAIDGIISMSTEAADEGVRLKALTWLAEQAVGKALVAVSGENGGPIRIDAREAYERFGALLARATKQG